ncbi:DUF3017 domain-containing protein [Streptomyces triticagri]|uniref:DUF3017 domain-containing protein n=1 Tax=Streptomyces triticagri TaxID=2293568 RepID=A0A372LXZ8_9ACTN|nr:DUF3017 domain-containing protein [Streptomyces triticagri]
MDAEQAGDTSGTDSGTDSGADTDTDSGTGAADSGASEGAGDGAKGVVSAPGPGGPRRRSRRFPRITRDTARPEGGGRAASGDAPAPARQWPMLTVLTITGLGLLITATGVFRVGTILIGVALLTGAVMRRVLPSVGMLAVRSRFTDMVTYGVLGVAITLLALMAQPNPVLEIPFLDDTLHFTISS